jgi:hypothetical protein
METPRTDANLFPRQTDATFSKDLTFARLCDLKFPLEIKVYVSQVFPSDISLILSVEHHLRDA